MAIVTRDQVFISSAPGEYRVVVDYPSFGDHMHGTTIDGKSHFGQVKSFREEFKEYSKEDFRSISKDPVVKDIMSGLSKIGIEEAKERIKAYLKTV